MLRDYPASPRVTGGESNPVWGSLLCRMGDRLPPGVTPADDEQGTREAMVPARAAEPQCERSRPGDQERPDEDADSYQELPAALSP